MKRSRWTILVAAVLLVFGANVVAGLWPQWGAASRRRDSCQYNLRQVAMGVAMYAQDFNGLYPRAQSGDAFATANTWVDDLQPYLKSRSTFHCPGALNDGISSEIISFGYNRNLNAKSGDSVKRGATMILNYEVTGSEIATCGSTKAAVTASGIHLKGANYTFTDGHARWFKLDEISEQPANGSSPSFQWK